MNAVVAALSLFAAEVRAEDLRWHTSEAKARDAARIERKPLLIYVTTGDCHFCRKMEKFTWGNEDVAKRLRRRFVLLKVDADLNPELADSLDVEAYPTTVIQTPDLMESTRVLGFIDGRRMLDRLDSVVAK